MQQGVEVRERGGFAGLIATAPFCAGDVLLPITGVVVREPSRYSLQIAESAHIVPPSEAMQRAAETENYRWCFMNHGCRPNVRIDAARRAMIALSDIAPGDELLFDYNTTEWDMAEPFTCHCGVPDCYGIVRGFRHLPPDQQARLVPIAAPHLLTLLGEREHLVEV